jgi:hypothetical protein
VAGEFDAAIVIDGGKVFISDMFTRARERLGISVQRVRPRTPTDKAIFEATPRATTPRPQRQSSGAERGSHPGRFATARNDTW